MNLIKITILAIICASTSAHDYILFIGNSFTIANNMKGIFKDIGKENKNRAITTEQSARGSASWASHVKDPYTLSLIRSRNNWKAVVLQEQSQFLSYPKYIYNLYSLQYLKLLDSVIQNHTGKITLFQTWGYEYGDYVQGDDYYKMQQRLISGYNDAYDTITLNRKSIAPVGQHWMNTFPEMNSELYIYDGKHPSKYGSFLAACVIYKNIYQIPRVKYGSRIKGINETTKNKLLKYCNENY